MTEVFGIIKVLGNCKDKITAACAAPKVNQEQIDKCKIIVKEFKEGTELCINVTKKEDKNKTCVEELPSIICEYVYKDQRWKSN